MTTPATADAVQPSTSGQGSQEALFGPRHRALTIGILAVISLVAFEAMAVATAMPVAVRDLDGLRLYGVAFSAFPTASLLGVVLAGRMSDRRGPLRPFLAGVAIFGLGLLLAGLAQQMWLLVLGRAVQGLGGGLNIVALYVAVARAYPEQMRPRLFSAMSSAWVIPAIVGPSVAGMITDELSWRWVFLAIPPLIAPAVALLFPRLRQLPPTEAEASTPRPVLPVLAVIAGVALLQYAGERLDAVSVPLAVLAGGLMVSALPKLLPSGTFRARRGLPTAILLRAVLAGSFFAAETFVPLMLIEQRGVATAVAGLALTGAATGWWLGAWIQGRPSTRWERDRLIRWGTGLVGTGIGLTSLTLWDRLPPLMAGLTWALAGMGMGLAMTSINVVVLELSPEADQGFNSAALQVSEAVGSILLVGVGGALFAKLYEPGGDGSSASFVAVYAVMAAVAVVGAVAAPRIAGNVVPQRTRPADQGLDPGWHCSASCRLGPWTECVVDDDAPRAASGQPLNSARENPRGNDRATAQAVRQHSRAHERKVR